MINYNVLKKTNIQKVFFEEKPNIIHVRSRVPSWTAGKVAKKMNIPLVSTIHGSYVANSVFKRFYNSASIKADKIIAISNYIKDNILKYNPESIDTLINSLDRKLCGKMVPAIGLYLMTASYPKKYNISNNNNFSFFKI